MVTTITTPDGIHYFRLAQLKGAIRLEGLGMRFKGGRSVLAHAKRELGLKGSREVVLAAIVQQMEALIVKKGEVG